MDNNLDMDVKNAKALGLSYGQYKALFYDPYATPTQVKKGMKIYPICRKDVFPPKICPICGKDVLHPRIKFCSDQCSKIHYKKYHEEYNRKRCLARYSKKLDAEKKEGV